MWKTGKSKEGGDEKNIRYSRILYMLVIAFVISWMSGVYFYLKDRFDIPHIKDVAVSDNGTNYTIGEFYSFDEWRTNPPYLTSTDYTILEKYNIGDIVMIRYFFIEGVIMDRSIPTGDNYSVLYKDKNYALHKITLPRKMLMIQKSRVSAY